MIVVKANKELYEKIKTLSSRLLCQASYVQCDAELTQDDVKEFIRMSDSQAADLAKIKEEMLAHIVRCNNEQKTTA